MIGLLDLRETSLLRKGFGVCLNNLMSVISRVLIGQHLIFYSATWPTYSNSPQKCMPVKWKVGQKVAYQFVEYTTFIGSDSRFQKLIWNASV